MRQVFGGCSFGHSMAASDVLADAWHRYGIRFRSRDRRHGDPFPLPRLRQSDNVGEQLRRRVDMAIKSVNDLASASFDNSAFSDSLPLTAVQKWPWMTFGGEWTGMEHHRTAWAPMMLLQTCWQRLTCMDRRLKVWFPQTFPRSRFSSGISK